MIHLLDHRERDWIGHLWSWDNLNVRCTRMLPCLPQSRVELGIGFHAHAKPVTATHGFGKFVVLPGGELVIFFDLVGVGVRLQDFFDTEDAIVHKQDDGVNPVPSHSPDLVCSQLVAAITLDQDDAT